MILNLGSHVTTNVGIDRTTKVDIHMTPDVGINMTPNVCIGMTPRVEHCAQWTQWAQNAERAQWTNRRMRATARKHARATVGTLQGEGGRQTSTLTRILDI